MIDLVIYGAGGFGKEIACLIHHNLDSEFNAKYNFIGFIDDGVDVGTEVKHGAVLGDVDFINKSSKPIAVIFSIANPSVLKNAFLKIDQPNVQYPNLIDPNVHYYDKHSFKMGKGNVLFNGCRFSVDVEIGDFNLCNGYVAFGHDVSVGDFNVFSPSSRVSGNVSIGDENFFGLNSAVLQGKNVNNRIRLGAGSILMNNARKEGALYFGNPARRIKE